MDIKIKLDEGAKVPTYATNGSAGMDLYSPVNAIVPAGGNVVIMTGISMMIPYGIYGSVVNRSGLNFKNGVTLHGCGTIDSDYRGVIGVKLYNDTDTDYYVHEGDRIAQIIFRRYEKVTFTEVEELESSDRGNGGFGHTGR